MSQPIEVACEICGQQSKVIMNSHINASGVRVEWPKANVKPEGIYFMVDCIKCGEHEQCVARPGDTQMRVSKS